ncbi:MAG: flagellar brake protein [Oscillospiraceae bacterium]|jgi:c-di-GMP-binding flagellar brake protein YcgR|nr:flagellar brake protein [Oscillospiraceae bacterium]
MVDIDKLNIGENIDLYTGKGSPYRTKIEDYDEAGNIMVSTPLYRGIPVILLRDQKLELYFYRESGRYMIEVSVKGLSMSGNVRMISLEILSKPQKQQRRESFRLKKSLDVTLREYVEGPFQFRPQPGDEKVEFNGTTEDISETGAGIRINRRFDEGIRVFVKLFLNFPSEDSTPLVFLSEVMQCTKVETVTSSYFKVGVRFIDHSPETRTMLRKYVMLEQQKIIKQQRLVEDK